VNGVGKPDEGEPHVRFDGGLLVEHDNVANKMDEEP
jgi:hypothetical protein